MGSYTQLEPDLSFLALTAFEGSARTRAESVNCIGLGGTGSRNNTDCEGVLYVFAEHGSLKISEFGMASL